ncbi:isoprenyl transferase [bacterium SCSIO 12741]|nr:isoprenyl transferase [bacterium SCSIO 12741]
MDVKDKIDAHNVPNHIAIIMDGNGRWARKIGKARIFGHRSAIKAVRNAVEASAEIGVKNLTLYAFSTENWNRPKREVNALMELLVNSMTKELPTLEKNNIRLMTIGDTDSLPPKCHAHLLDTMEKTKDNKRMNLILALSYSSRWEIMNAVKKVISDAKHNNLDENEFTEDDFKQYLSTANIPDPELMIRTSGEQRISNFLLWQLAYTELIFLEKLWPDFTKDDLYLSVLKYQGRERRFGKTSEQVQPG